MVDKHTVDEPGVRGHSSFGTRNRDSSTTNEHFIASTQSPDSSSFPGLKPRFWKPDPPFEQKGPAVGEDDKAVRLSPDNALRELNSLISKSPNVIGRFVEWHEKHDPALNQVADVDVILTELARSPGEPGTGSNHQMWRRCADAIRKITDWKGSDTMTWEEAYRRRGNMPFLPQHSALAALRYLDTIDEFIPLLLEQGFASVNLSSFVFGQAPAGFWKGARLDDPGWRREHMKPGLIPKPLPINTKRLLVLMEIVLSNGLKPHSINRRSAENPSEHHDLPTIEPSVEDKHVRQTEDGNSKSTFERASSSTGDTLSPTRHSKRPAASNGDGERPKRQKTEDQGQETAEELKQMKDQAREPKEAWVDGLAEIAMDGLVKEVGRGLGVYKNHILELVGMIYDQQQLVVAEMNTRLARRIGRLEEELDELRAMVKKPNSGINHDDSEGSEQEKSDC